MPRSDETANQFMSQGMNGSVSESHAYDIDVCFPQNATVPGHDLSGGIKVQPAGVDYNPIPEVKNPRSVSDQTPKLDAQGK